MNDNDKNIAKDILLIMIEKNIGEFSHDISIVGAKAINADVIGMAYQKLLMYVSGESINTSSTD
jgi:hypothetical protein